MKPKISENRALYIGGAVFAVLIMVSVWSPRPIPLDGIARSIEEKEISIYEMPAPVGLPVRLHIPKLDIDTTLEYVGLTASGSLDTPKSPSDAGWFEFGTRPGEIGSAVIDGHFGWKDNIPAIFDDLYILQTGDKIFVESTDGTIITFIVRELRNYGPDDDAYGVFNSHDGLAHLNLITCQGVWNKDKKSYSERLVVFADREE